VHGRKKPDTGGELEIINHDIYRPWKEGVRRRRTKAEQKKKNRQPLTRGNIPGERGVSKGKREVSDLPPLKKKRVEK